MKKITFFFALGLFSVLSINAQQVLSHSTDNTTFVNDASIACAGGGTTADNIFSRSYTPSDFSFTGDFEIQGAQFFMEFTDGSGGATVDIIVRVSSTDAPFPGGVLTELTSETVTIEASDDGLLQEITFTTPVVVDADDEIVLEVDIPDNVDPVLYDARVGVNAAGQNAPSYIFSNACGLTTPTDFGAIGFPDNHLVLDLIGDVPLSTEENSILAQNISLSPNPTQGDLNLNFSRSFGDATVEIVNVSGQVVAKQQIAAVGNNTLPTSKLANGVYFAQISTDQASTTIKFIKN